MKSVNRKTVHYAPFHRRPLSVFAVATLPLILSSCLMSPDNPTLGEYGENTENSSLSQSYFDSKTEITYTNAELEGLTSEEFELPLGGSTGYASIDTPVYYSDDTSSDIIATLHPGDAFTVLSERDDHWWMVAIDNNAGWIDNKYCYLNISDVVPSAIVDNTNSSASVFVSSGKSIPGITGERLYQAVCRNDRLKSEQAVMAASYGTVKKIYKAQQAAMKDGYTLILNETFRPYDVQTKVADGLSELCREDRTVNAGVNRSPWGAGWFVSQGVSSHQRGCAMDVSLGKIESIEYRLAGEYKYAVVTKYSVCRMPTAIHELSAAAVSLSRPVDDASDSEWRKVAPASTMTDDALRLREYCVDAGFTPLASEWWHFNDLESLKQIGTNYTTDAYRINTCRSTEP